MKTEVPFETANKTNTELRSKSTLFLPQDDRNERDKIRTELAVPVLNENSIMQRLLIEFQGQEEPRMRSKAAAIKEEITQRTDNTDTATKQTVITTESAPRVEQQRLVSQIRNSEADENLQLENRNHSTQDVSERKNKKNFETAVEQPKKQQTD